MVDHALAHALANDIKSAARRIVLVTPVRTSRTRKPESRGFNGYLVKPVRAASLAARLSAAPSHTDSMADIAVDQPSRSNAAGLSILVAEDNDINVLLIRALLDKSGHRPTIVAERPCGCRSIRHSGQRGHALRSRADGPAHARARRAGGDAPHPRRRSRINLPRTRIVALTANAFGEDRDACLAAGMDDFLVKPLDRDRLAGVLSPLQASTLAA